MDFSKSFTHNGKYGIKFQPITNYQTAMTVHPDHVGFVIGFNGGTIKKVAHECDCYIRIQEPNEFSKGWPWFVFKGDHPDKICEAFRQISNIAKEAERRMPRINQQKATQEKPTQEKPTQEKPTKEKPTEVKATQAKDGWHVRMKGGDDTLYFVERATKKVFSGDEVVGVWNNGKVYPHKEPEFNKNTSWGDFGEKLDKFNQSNC